MGLRVLHVVNAYQSGGMENMIAQMAWRLPDYQVSVGVCALTTMDTFKRRLPPEVETFELRKRPGFDLNCARSLRQLITHLKPDIVHSHNWNGLIYSVCGTARTPYRLVHGEHAQFYEWEKSRVRLLLRTALYSQCDLVHTVSNGQAAELEQLNVIKASKISVVKNGVDTGKFTPTSKRATRQRLGINAEGLFMGMIARFVPEKRHKMLLEAFEIAGAMNTSLSLVLAGSGGMCEDDVRRQVAVHPFADRIYWLGHRSDMADVYNSLDLMILPSLAEGMSNVCLEAMSCGVPVIVHQACGANELIKSGSNGIVAKLDTSRSIADSILGILADPEELRNIAERARISIVHDYPIAKTADKYAEIYQQFAALKEPCH